MRKDGWTMAKKTRHVLVMKSGREIPITGIRAATDEECDALTAAEDRKKRKRG